MKKDVVLDSFRNKCKSFNLELLSDEILEGRILVGCALHGGAWSASVFDEITLKSKLANCPDCFAQWLKDVPKS